jgi:hypothetical protein
VGAFILIIATITTLSTTAYVGLMVTFLLFYRARGGSLITFLILGVPILAVVSQLPFLFDKINKTYDRDVSDISTLETLSAYYQRTGEGEIHLNRFASATILYKTFGFRLLWGVSNGYEGAAKALDNVNISNGDFDFMAKYGLIGFCFLLYRYCIFFKNFVYKNELVFYSLLIYLVLAFGEPMPIFQTSLMFLFLYHYCNPDTLSMNEYEGDEEVEEDEEEEAEQKGVILNRY